MFAAFSIDLNSSVTIVPRPGLRVVIFEPDPTHANSLEAMLAMDSLFVLVGRARGAEECERLIAEYVPEILICRESALSAISRADLSAFLLFLEPYPRVVLREEETGRELPLEQSELPATIARIKSRVLERKASEILRLLKAARAVSDGTVPRYDDVRWVDADGNYLVLHTQEGAIRRRGTLSSFLNTSAQSFVRVSRSRAVQRAQIQRIAITENRLHLILKCGTALRVSRSCQRQVRRIYNA